MKRHKKVKKRWFFIGILLLLLGMLGFVAQNFTDMRMGFIPSVIFVVCSVLNVILMIAGFVMRNIFNKDFAFVIDIATGIRKYMEDVPVSQLRSGYLPLLWGWLAGNAIFYTIVGAAILFIAIARNGLLTNRAATVKALKRIGIAAMAIFSVAAALCGIVGLFLGMPTNAAVALIGLGLMSPLVVLLTRLISRMMPDDDGQSSRTVMLQLFTIACFALGYFGLLLWICLFSGSPGELYEFFSGYFVQGWFNPMIWIMQILTTPCLFWKEFLLGSAVFGVLLIYSCKADMRRLRQENLDTDSMKKGLTVVGVLISLLYTVLLSRPMFDRFTVMLFGRTHDIWSWPFTFLLAAVYLLNLLFSQCWMYFAWRTFVLEAKSSLSRFLAVCAAPLYLAISAGMTYVLYTLIGALLGIGVIALIFYLIIRLLSKRDGSIVEDPFVYDLQWGSMSTMPVSGEEMVILMHIDEAKQNYNQLDYNYYVDQLKKARASRIRDGD